jgi:hypothetical protein
MFVTKGLFLGEPPMDRSVKINRLAMVSFISGIIVIAILGFGMVWQLFPASPTYANTIRTFLDLSVSVQFLFAPVALVTGILALREIKKKSETEKGKILAWIGILLGAGYILFGLLIFIIFSASLWI